MKYVKITLWLILLVMIGITWYILVIFFDDTKGKYRNLSQTEKSALDKKFVASKEDLYSNGLLYNQITDFVIKNKVIILSLEEEPYGMDILDTVTGGFKKTECIDQCFIDNKTNVFDAMKQLGIIRIVNTKIHPFMKNEQIKYILFVKDQITRNRGDEKGYMRYFNPIGKEKFTDGSDLIEPIDDHWAVFRPTGKRDKYGKLYPSD